MYSTKWTERRFLGKRKEDGRMVYIAAPTWDCNWYWSFGYLKATGEHYHLRNCNINWKDGLERDYILNVKLRGDNLWKFYELAKTAYGLRDAAEILGKGGSNLTENSLREAIKNKAEVDRINQIVLPQIFDAINEMFD
ncbi:MAG: hypothetical protein PX635_19195 [Nostocales cyanobacterium LE14-WE12]|jgi:hypothetical protein|nr:hypothetical protein [Nostocales cyanobacterium LE14-WE12]